VGGRAGASMAIYLTVFVEKWLRSRLSRSPDLKEDV
jgi:hypothetical protein